MLSDRVLTNFILSEEVQDKIGRTQVEMLNLNKRLGQQTLTRRRQDENKKAITDYTKQEHWCLSQNHNQR